MQERRSASSPGRAGRRCRGSAACAAASGASARHSGRVASASPQLARPPSPSWISWPPPSRQTSTDQPGRRRHDVQQMPRLPNRSAAPAGSASCRSRGFRDQQRCASSITTIALRRRLRATRRSGRETPAAPGSRPPCAAARPADRRPAPPHRAPAPRAAHAPASGCRSGTPPGAGREGQVQPAQRLARAGLAGHEHHQPRALRLAPAAPPSATALAVRASPAGPARASVSAATSCRAYSMHAASSSAGTGA